MPETSPDQVQKTATPMFSTTSEAAVGSSQDGALGLLTLIATTTAMAAEILGGGKASRLYKKLVYERQIAQDVDASQNSQGLASTFVIDVTARPGVEARALEAAIPLGRIGTPEQMGQLVCFVASDAGSYITATTIMADGGLMQKPGAV